MSEAGRTATIVKWVVATTVVAMVLVFLVDLVEGPVYSFSTQAWPPARQGDKMIGGIQGLVKATDSPASTVRISAGFLGLGSLPVAVTPETKIAVNGKLGGFGDLDRGQRVRVTYEVHPDRLVAARVEVLDRSSDASDAPVPDEQTSEAMVPVPQRGTAPASPPERSARPPTSASSRTALRPQRVTPPPVTSARPTRPPAAPVALQNTQDAVRPARRPATSPAASVAAPDPGVQGPTTPDANHEATALAPMSTPAPPPPSVSPPSSPSAPAEPALVDKIRDDWETIKRDARRSGDEWRDGWRRLKRLFTD